MKKTSLREALDHCVSEINFSNIAQYRKIKNINPHYTYIDEIKTIEGLFKSLQKDCKKHKYYFCATSMWEIHYTRYNKKFNLNLFFAPEQGAFEEGIC